MTIYQLFHDGLKRMRDAGATNREIAEKVGCSHQQINRMLNKGAEYFEKVEFRTLVKLFPEIFDEILRKYGAQGGGAGQAIVNSPGAATVNGNANSVHIAQGAALAAAELKILDDTDICDKCKVRVLRIIKGK